VVSAVQKLQSQLPQYTVSVTGHSLGAALATLTALDLLFSPAIDARGLQLVNFGSPRVGNTKFAEFASGALAGAGAGVYSPHSRVTHYKDIVPHCPMHERFTHIDGEQYISTREFTSLQVLLTTTTVLFSSSFFFFFPLDNLFILFRSVGGAVRWV
jgi:predicted lipase